LWLEVVHDDDVAWLERGREELFDISEKDCSVHGAVDHQRRGDAVVSQAGNEGRGLPMPVRNAGDDALATRCPTVSARHVRRRPGLVDEDKPRRIHIWLALAPGCAGLGNVGSVLLSRVLRLFLSVSPSRSSAFHIPP